MTVKVLQRNECGLSIITELKKNLFHFLLSYFLGLFVSCVVTPPPLPTSHSVSLPSSSLLFLWRPQCNWSWRGLQLNISLGKNSLKLQRKKNPGEKPKGFHLTLPHSCAFSSPFCVCELSFEQDREMTLSYIILRSEEPVLVEKHDWWREHEKQHTELSVLPRTWRHSHRTGASEGKLTHYQHQVIYSWAEFGFIADWLIKHWEKPSIRALFTDSFLLLSTLPESSSC